MCILKNPSSEIAEVPEKRFLCECDLNSEKYNRDVKCCNHSGKTRIATFKAINLNCKGAPSEMLVCEGCIDSCFDLLCWDFVCL